jgi:hypothetical protein
MGSRSSMRMNPPRITSASSMVVRRSLPGERSGETQTSRPMATGTCCTAGCCDVP